MKNNKFLNNKRSKISLIICLLSPLTLYGCNTIEGVGTDIKQGGKALERSAEHAKTCSASCPPCPCCKR